MTKKEIRELKKLNKTYKKMLMKVQMYGEPLTPKEIVINNQMIVEARKKRIDA